MSSVDNHRQVNMAPTAIQPILFYTIVTEGHYMYMLCSNEERFEKVEQSCLTVIWKISCQRSHIIMLVCMVLPPCFYFASLVCFGSF